MRAVELFSGAGGLGLGASKAGIHVVLAVEADKDAAATYQENHPETKVLVETIDAGWDITEVLKQQHIDGPIDLIMGGPPCQGWSSLGARAKSDTRASMNACVEYFLDQVHRLKPRAFLMENVRGLHVAANGERLGLLTAHLADSYDIKWDVLRAADYGVPQLRHRLFVVGIRRDLEVTFSFPKPTHTEKEYITVRDAIGDLPALSSGEVSEMYSLGELGDYQSRLRGECKTLSLHEAPAHPVELVQLLSQIGEGQARSDLDESIRPKSGFHNTYGRLRWDSPAPAVTAAIGRVSSGRHTHPRDHRALTPREAARLQGFPDSYKWAGTRWHVYKMIGNAVPPQLASTVLASVGDALSMEAYAADSQVAQ